jgi:hypothetical protein
MVPPNVWGLGRVTVISSYRHRHAANLPERLSVLLLAVSAAAKRSGKGLGARES